MNRGELPPPPGLHRTPPLQQNLRTNRPLQTAARAVAALPLFATLVTAPFAADGRQGAGFRSATLTVAPGTQAGFTRMDPAATGLSFSNLVAESRHFTNQILLNGSGIAAGDVDGDGRTDVFCPGFDNDNALFRNLGDWRFENIAGAAGVELAGLDCTGAALADLDGDGDLDLVVNTLGQGTLVLFNDGRGRFTRSPDLLNAGRAGMTVAIGDVDGDGRLDLFIVNYRSRALMDMPGTRMTFRKEGGKTLVDTVNGRPASDPEFLDRFAVNANGGIEENGEPPVLYRNTDGTHFEAVPWTGGAFLDEQGAPLARAPLDWGLAAMFRDVNGDGRPDLYVCNDFQSPDRLWLNQGGGRFRLAPATALRHTSLSSMAVDFGDVNRDGHDDFIVFDMLSRSHAQRMRWVRDSFPHRPVIGRHDDRPQVEQNTLQLGRGDATWSEAAQYAGLEASEWAWSGAFVDVDLDGWDDLLVVSGMERAARDIDVAERLKAARSSRRMTDAEIFQNRRQFPRLATGHLAFRNQGGGRFVDASHAWGFELPAVSEAIALADLDGDGDLDVLVGNLNAGVSVYRNNAPAPRIAVRLAGRALNTRGIGARIEVTSESEPGRLAPESQEMIAGGRYLSSDDPVRSFAAVGAGPFSVRVRWNGGAVSTVASVAPNSLVEVEEPAAPGGIATNRPAASAPVTARFRGFQFEDLTSSLGHRHVEEDFDDFSRQPLLPWKLSQPGPGVAWCDLDGDGRDDLVVGAGRGGTLAAFRNSGTGRLIRWDLPSMKAPLVRDATALVAWPRTNGTQALLVGLANYEDGAALGPAVSLVDASRGSMDETVPASECSTGPLAMADIDGDGDLDLFVGGRVIPGRWPAAASSRFFRNEAGRFVFDAERSRVLNGIGLVNGALFTDLDGDGSAELVLACEWGPVRVLRGERTGFVDITEAAGLTPYSGWWNSVAAGDFDGDGRMDLVAGNWGSNTPYERHRRSPLPAGEAGGAVRVYHEDFQGDGVHDILESGWDSTLAKFVPLQPLGTLAQAWPALRERFPTHAALSEASVQQVLGDAFARAKVVHAGWLETTVFLNRGGRFEAHALPVEAQLAPVFGVVVADVDGDGAEDIFVAQNFFALRPYFPRLDGGTGAWLKGDGKGGFEAVPGLASGIRIEGEQRGAAAGDFDGDGRIDLVVGQNGASTRLFRNRDGHPGLRVQLIGTTANPSGAGAQLRWKDVTPCAAHEVHLGGGWLSQDSQTQVLARPDRANVLNVRWPGGVSRDYQIPDSAKGVALEFGGAVRNLQ